MADLNRPSNARSEDACDGLSPHVLHKMDEDVLRRQRERLGAMSEVWTLAAMHYSIEGEPTGDRAMMKLAHIYSTGHPTKSHVS